MAYTQRWGTPFLFDENGNFVGVKQPSGMDMTMVSPSVLYALSDERYLKKDFSNTIAVTENTTTSLLPATLTADGKFGAIEAQTGVLGETVAFGETVYFKAADSRWWKTKADAAATSGPVRVGYCVAAGNAGDATTILFRGLIRADALYDTLTASAPVFLSASTAGKISNTAPSGTTNYVVRIVGHAVDANTVHVNISNDYIELA
jgi:hypothetical protein